MHTTVVRTARLGLVTIRPLAGGDTATVEALFGRLGVESRARRFNGAKLRLSSTELGRLATVDSRHHTLVAHVEGDAEPAGIAQLVRDADNRDRAEIAFAVADCYQGSGVGTTLAQLLAADARAAGITHLTAVTQSSNSAARSLIRKVSSRVETLSRGGELEIVATLEAPDAGRRSLGTGLGESVGGVAVSSRDAADLVSRGLSTVSHRARSLARRGMPT